MAPSRRDCCTMAAAITVLASTSLHAESHLDWVTTELRVSRDMHCAGTIMALEGGSQFSVDVASIFIRDYVDVLVEGGHMELHDARAHAISSAKVETELVYPYLANPELKTKMLQTQSECLLTLYTKSR